MDRWLLRPALLLPGISAKDKTIKEEQNLVLQPSQNLLLPFFISDFLGPFIHFD